MTEVYLCSIKGISVLTTVDLYWDKLWSSDMIILLLKLLTTVNMGSSSGVEMVEEQETGAGSKKGSMPLQRLEVDEISDRLMCF